MRHGTRFPLVAALISVLAIVPAGEARAAENGSLTVMFRESAPKDSFTIRNDGPCALRELSLTIDLKGSAGGMIFDTVGTGPGVQVFQPFALVSGANRVTGLTELADGGTAMTLELTGLSVGETVSFTIDVDDTLAQSARGQSQVTGAEIAGATVVAVSARTGQRAQAAFGADTKTQLIRLSCLN